MSLGGANGGTEGGHGRIVTNDVMAEQIPISYDDSACLSITLPFSLAPLKAISKNFSNVAMGR